MHDDDIGQNTYRQRGALAALQQHGIKCLRGVGERRVFKCRTHAMAVYIVLDAAAQPCFDGRRRFSAPPESHRPRLAVPGKPIQRYCRDSSCGGQRLLRRRASAQWLPAIHRSVAG